MGGGDAAHHGGGLSGARRTRNRELAAAAPCAKGEWGIANRQRSGGDSAVCGLSRGAIRADMRMGIPRGDREVYKYASARFHLMQVRVFISTDGTS